MITSRPEPEFRWLIDSLRPQILSDERIVFWIVDGYLNRDTADRFQPIGIKNGYGHSFVKPNIWQGEYRKTPVDWWAKSSAINTALCLCKTEWIMFLDDRCVLMPGFMAAVRDAMKGNYIMAGAYEKRTEMTVEDGVIKNAGIITGRDGRARGDLAARSCSGQWLFGCCTLAPLEYWLNINGAPEECDGLSFEDVIIGLLFENNGYPIKYDERALMIEDRTPEMLGDPMRRSSKESHPHDTSDKAHTLLKWVRGGAKRSINPFDIRELRERIQIGEPFPVPEDRDYFDWHDGENLKDMI